MGPWALAPGHFNQRSSVGLCHGCRAQSTKSTSFLNNSLRPRPQLLPLGWLTSPWGGAQGSSCPPGPAPVCLLVRSRQESPAFSKAPSILLKGLRLWEWKLN